GQMADRVLIGLRESGGKTSARLTKLPALKHDKPGTGANERGQTETAGSQPSYGPDSMNSATPRELARPDSVPICRLFTSESSEPLQDARLEVLYSEGVFDGNFDGERNFVLKTDGAGAARRLIQNN